MDNFFWPVEFSDNKVKDAFGGRLCCYVIALEAWRRGLEVTLKDGRCRYFSISGNGRKVDFDKSSSEFNSAEGKRNCIDKQKTKHYLLARGIPTPEGRMFDAGNGFHDALVYAEELGYPVVVKPVRGSVGIGVFTDIKDAKRLEECFDYNYNVLGKSKIIVERQVRGEDYRAYVVGGNVSAVVQRVPANVTGDGVSTIFDLIKNKNSIRKKNPFLSKGLIKVDREVMFYVGAAGLTLDSVLEAGFNLQLRGKANASSGGDVIDVTETIGQHLKEVALNSVKAIPGLFQGGVDILYDAFSGDVSVLEINYRAHIGVNMYPTEGIGRSVPKDIVDSLFPDFPRRREKIYNRLVFDIKSAMDLMKRGVAKDVTIAAVNYPKGKRLKHVKVEFSYSDIQQCEKVFAKAFVLGINGSARFLSRGAVIYLSSSEEAVDKLVSYIESTVGRAISIKSWRGVICQGFKIHRKME